MWEFKPMILDRVRSQPQPHSELRHQQWKPKSPCNKLNSPRCWQGTVSSHHSPHMFKHTGSCCSDMPHPFLGTLASLNQDPVLSPQGLPTL